MTGTTDMVASPCVSVCNMDAATGLCVGCLRTLDEIACWSVLHDEDKLAVLAELQQRRAQWDCSGVQDTASPQPSPPSTVEREQGAPSPAGGRGLG